MRSLHPPIATNGTRAIITKLHPNLIEAKVSVGPYKNEIILIPRIPTVPSDYNIPIPFKCVQFPVKLYFAITISKSQGHTFACCGVDLSMPVFTHGMLYVALSRTGNPNHLTICSPTNSTRNVVYREIFQ